VLGNIFDDRFEYISIKVSLCKYDPANPSYCFNDTEIIKQVEKYKLESCKIQINFIVDYLDMDDYGNEIKTYIHPIYDIVIDLKQ